MNDEKRKVQITLYKRRQIVIQEQETRERLLREWDTINLEERVKERIEHFAKRPHLHDCDIYWVLGDVLGEDRLKLQEVEGNFEHPDDQTLFEQLYGGCDE
jgi:hypothetical protein